MSRRFLLDENIPLELARWLGSQLPGCEVLSIRDQLMLSSADSDVLAKAIELRATLITFDEDFSDRRFIGSTTHFGILVLNVEPTTVEAAAPALAHLFQKWGEKSFENQILTVELSRFRGAK